MSGPVSRPTSLSASFFRSPSGFECDAPRQPIVFDPATLAAGYAEVVNNGAIAWTFTANDVAYGLQVFDQTGSIVCFGELVAPLTATAGGTVRLPPGNLRVRLR
jgi:hypothetical protein